MALQMAWVPLYLFMLNRLENNDRSTLFALWLMFMSLSVTFIMLCACLSV